jgi:ornithine carbamoyltransferase
LKLAYVGDGNNVAHSLMLCCARLGMNMSVATPAGYAPRTAVIAQAIEFSRISGARIEVMTDPIDAVQNAHAIYTDVWTSMGQESEAGQRQTLFAPYQVNEILLSLARPDTLFMHCLPAKRGQEVTDAVMESPQCIAFDQAENRLHVQKAVLLMMLQ